MVENESTIRTCVCVSVGQEGEGSFHCACYIATVDIGRKFEIQTDVRTQRTSNVRQQNDIRYGDDGNNTHL